MDYWLRSTPEKKQSFPDISWNKPENKRYAGKLLIIGGSKTDIATPMKSYMEAKRAGVGVIKVLMPDSCSKIVGIHEDIEFAPSNLSGSFDLKALEQMIALSAWADATLLCGGMGNNSQTSVIVEKFVTKYDGILCLAGDSVDHANKELASLIVMRKDTLIVATIGQLQPFLAHARCITPLFSRMSLVQLAEALHAITNSYGIAIQTKHEDYDCLAYSGKVYTQKSTNTASPACSVVYWLQHPKQLFEAIVTSLEEN